MDKGNRNRELNEIIQALPPQTPFERKLTIYVISLRKNIALPLTSGLIIGIIPILTWSSQKRKIYKHSYNSENRYSLKHNTSHTQKVWISM